MAHVGDQGRGEGRLHRNPCGLRGRGDGPLELVGRERPHGDGAGTDELGDPGVGERLVVEVRAERDHHPDPPVGMERGLGDRGEEGVALGHVREREQLLELVDHQQQVGRRVREERGDDAAQARHRTAGHRPTRGPRTWPPRPARPSARRTADRPGASRPRTTPPTRGPRPTATRAAGLLPRPRTCRSGGPDHRHEPAVGPESAAGARRARPRAGCGRGSRRCPRPRRSAGPCRDCASPLPRRPARASAPTRPRPAAGPSASSRTCCGRRSRLPERWHGRSPSARRRAARRRLLRG